MPLTRCSLNVTPTALRHERQELLIVFVERSGDEHCTRRRRLCRFRRAIRERKPSAPIGPWLSHRGSFAIGGSKPRQDRHRRAVLCDLSGSGAGAGCEPGGGARVLPLKFPCYLAGSVLSR
jgi:hypothetical protein